MAIKITKKIKGYSVTKPEDKAKEAAPVAAMPAPIVIERPMAEIIQMHEKVERPEALVGATYKIKSPLVEHAMYVTINDIVLNPGTEYELRRPFEVFINSKNMDHFQWVVAITRIMSAVFRKGGDVTFLVEEMKAVFDPRGGYFKAGGVYMPSIVAEIGSVVEEHLKSIGMIVDPELSDGQRQLIADKRAAYENRAKKNAESSSASSSQRKLGPSTSSTDGNQLTGDLAGAGADSASRADEAVSVTGEGASFPPSASMCFKCNTKATVILDGCATCLNCGYSKCG
jgi:hypothetical protein